MFARNFTISAVSGDAREEIVCRVGIVTLNRSRIFKPQQQKLAEDSTGNFEGIEAAATLTAEKVPRIHESMTGENCSIIYLQLCVRNQLQSDFECDVRG
jgi:hypothetical protein